MRSGILTVGLLLAMVGCSDGSGPSTVPVEIVGEWEASPACLPQCGLTLHTVTGPADSISVTRLFLTTLVTISAQGNFRIETFPMPADAVPITGTAKGGGGQLTVRAADGREETVAYGVSGNFLTLEFGGTFDFNGDGTQQPARARGVFRKR